MKSDTYEKLFDLSYKTKERLVTPFLLDYFNFEMSGFKEDDIVRMLQNKADIQKVIEGKD